MQQVPIIATPNQELAFNADGSYWQLSVYQAATHMCADVSRDGNALIQGVRCFVGQPLLPYPYMTSGGYGNLVFDSEPDWNNFGTTCNLYYLSQVELAQFQELLLTSA